MDGDATGCSEATHVDAAKDELLTSPGAKRSHGGPALGVHEDVQERVQYRGVMGLSRGSLEESWGEAVI